MTIAQVGKGTSTPTSSDISRVSKNTVAPRLKRIFTSTLASTREASDNKDDERPLDLTVSKPRPSQQLQRIDQSSRRTSCHSLGEHIYSESQTTKVLPYSKADLVSSSTAEFSLSGSTEPSHCCSEKPQLIQSEDERPLKSPVLEPPYRQTSSTIIHRPQSSSLATSQYPTHRHHLNLAFRTFGVSPVPVQGCLSTQDPNHLATQVSLTGLETPGYNVAATQTLTGNTPSDDHMANSGESSAQSVADGQPDSVPAVEQVPEKGTDGALASDEDHPVEQKAAQEEEEVGEATDGAQVPDEDHPVDQEATQTDEEVGKVTGGEPDSRPADDHEGTPSAPDVASPLEQPPTPAATEVAHTPAPGSEEVKESTTSDLPQQILRAPTIRLHAASGADLGPIEPPPSRDVSATYLPPTTQIDLPEVTPAVANVLASIPQVNVPEATSKIVNNIPVTDTNSTLSIDLPIGEVGIRKKAIRKVRYITMQRPILVVLLGHELADLARYGLKTLANPGTSLDGVTSAAQDAGSIVPDTEAPAVQHLADPPNQTSGAIPSVDV